MAETESITVADLEKLPDLERCGFWLRVDFLKDGEVYYVRGKLGNETGIALRMPVEQFVAEYNAGIPLPRSSMSREMK